MYREVAQWRRIRRRIREEGTRSTERVSILGIPARSSIGTGCAII
jgi:hypothetical protein